MPTTHHSVTLPQTQAVRRLLEAGVPGAAIEDLIFLEAWERDPAPDLAAARRVVQIRRAQPALAAAIRSELAALHRRANVMATPHPFRD